MTALTALSKLSGVGGWQIANHKMTWLHIEEDPQLGKLQLGALQLGKLQLGKLQLGKLQVSSPDVYPMYTGV